MSSTSFSVAKPSDYLDFELEVTAGAGGQYPAVITRSPAGQAQAALRLTFDEAALESFLKEPDQMAGAFGQALFASLFTGDLRRLYVESVEQTALLNKGVRLKLHFRPPELAALPWEYMYAPDPAGKVSLSPQTLMVRYQAALKPRWPLLLKTPLRILGVVASPRGCPAIDGEAEKQKLESALQEAKTQGLVSLTWLGEQSWQSLEDTLAQSTWNILHVIGHSGFDRERGEDYLVLADSTGGPLHLSAAQLSQALGRQASLRLLILNVDEETQIGHASGLAASLVDQGLPAALVIPYLSQHAAPIFARLVYEMLANNGPVDCAVQLARTEVRQAGASVVAWGLPALYMQAPDGLLFNVLGPAEAQLANRAAEIAPVPQRTELDHLVEELAEREIQVQDATERLALLRIEIARMAGEQTERAQQAVESAKRLAVVKAEVVRLAGEQAEQERQVEAVTQRLLVLMSEAERLAGEQADRAREIEAAEGRVKALTAEGERLAEAQQAKERQLRQAAEQWEERQAELARLAGEQAEGERQVQQAQAALAALNAELDRLKDQKAEHERQAEAAAALTTDHLATLQAAVERLEAEQAEREHQIEQQAGQVKAVEADYARLTQQAAEQTQLVQQATDRVAALQAEAQRQTDAARANWARARLRYLLWGAVGGAALLAVVAAILSRFLIR
jgi:hypothetical protein